LVERGEVGREASFAAGGMLANCGDESVPALKPLADASAAMYPEFVRELQDESGVNPDLRSNGTLLFPAAGISLEELPDVQPLPEPIDKLEPGLAAGGRSAVFLAERSVCPRTLVKAVHKAAQHRGVDISQGEQVVRVEVADDRVAGIATTKTTFFAPKVVNCAGAWAGQLPPYEFPTRPVKGQMLCFALPRREMLRHVVRSPEIYLIPRSDGRLLVGATLEEAGFDKRTVPETIQRLHRAAVAMMPALNEARILEDWAGLRPGTPDNLPILGETRTPGYYVATGHYRDGILLAPVTARAMTQIISGGRTEYDLAPFRYERFRSRAA
jgi:glycine oxidase